MNVLAIVGTARKNGLISRLTDSLLNGAREAGHEADKIFLHDYAIQPCKGCWHCARNDHCVIKDDFHAIHQKMRRADVIVLASPVYFSNIAGNMKLFFDRFIGYDFNKFPDADRYPKMKFREKIPAFLDFASTCSPSAGMSNKKFLYVISANVPFPFSKIIRDVSLSKATIKAFIGKMKGKILGKIVFTDALFRFMKNKEKKFIARACRMGQGLK
jgi:multimeric flavodoxin WrbA